MKYLLALAAAVTVLGFAIPASADAHDYGYGSRRIVSHLRCGRPVYAVYEVHGYDRCGNPIGQWVTQRSHCDCSVCSPRPSCPPDYGYGHGYGRFSSSPYYSRPSFPSYRGSGFRLSLGW